jgi:hypothetical protein
MLKLHKSLAGIPLPTSQKITNLRDARLSIESMSANNCRLQT